MTDRIVAEAFPPGDFISEELEARGWSPGYLADAMGQSVDLVQELLDGNLQVTPEVAEQLGAVFDTGAQLWLNLEASYQSHMNTKRRVAGDRVAV